MSVIVIGFTDQHSLARCRMVETSRQASVEGSHAWLDSDCLGGWMQVTGYSHHLAHHHCFWQAWRWRLLHTLHTLYYHMLHAVLHVTQVTLPQVTSHSVVAGVAPLDHVIQISSPLAMLITPWLSYVDVTPNCFSEPLPFAWSQRMPGTNL